MYLSSMNNYCLSFKDRFFKRISLIFLIQRSVPPADSEEGEKAEGTSGRAPRKRVEESEMFTISEFQLYILINLY